MAGRLEGKVCIITGSGGGVGRASSLLFAQEGARVVGADVNVQAAEETVRIVRAAGGQIASLHPCDVSSAAGCEKLIQFAISTYGGVNILFNNAASVVFKPLPDLTRQDWDHTILHELTLVYQLSKVAWTALQRSKGVILNMASMSAWRTVEGLGGAAHCAANSGIVALSRQLASEGREYGIRVNSLSPGLIENPANTAPWTKSMLRKSLSGAMARPQEIANVALFLVCDESSYIHGADIIADGGVSISV